MIDFLSRYWIFLLVAAVISYLIGGINSSIISSKILGINKDIRTLGSGNAGFTNALRTLGKKAAILSFVGDFTKGVIAVFIAIKIASLMPHGDDYSFLTLEIFAYLASFMCVIGHIYPCFFSFRGGKGILTAWASTMLIDWRIFLVLISVFLVVFLATKVVSIASICAAISYPLAALGIGFYTHSSREEILVAAIFSFATALPVVLKHRSNIERILKGEEKKISVGKGE